MSQNLVIRVSVDIPVPADNEGVKLAKTFQKKIHRGIARLQGQVYGNQSGKYTTGSSRVILKDGDTEKVIVPLNREAEMMDINFTVRSDSGAKKTNDLAALLAASGIDGVVSSDDDDDDVETAAPAATAGSVAADDDDDD